jgi:hypothetical protein
VSQRGELLCQLLGVRRDAGGGFDLAAAQFQLQGGAAAAGLGGHLAVARRRLTSPRVDEKKFLFHAEGREIALRARSAHAR